MLTLLQHTLTHFQESSPSPQRWHYSNHEASSLMIQTPNTKLHLPTLLCWESNFNIIFWGTQTIQNYFIVLLHAGTDCMFNIQTFTINMQNSISNHIYLIIVLCILYCLLPCLCPKKTDTIVCIILVFLSFDWFQSMGSTHRKSEGRRN